MALDWRKKLWLWDNRSQDIAAGNPGQIKTSVLQLEEIQVRKVAIGKSCAVVVSEDDKIYTLGEAGGKELTLSGLESSIKELSLLGSHQVSEVACGYHHIAVVTKSGAAFCWGASTFGQCGVVADLVSTPRRVEIANAGHPVNLKNVSCGKYHTMAISENLELWGWGASHLIGNSVPQNRKAVCLRPEVIQHLYGRKVLQVSCGKSHTVVITEKIQKTGSNPPRPDSMERCDRCGHEIYKWGDMELM